MTRQRLPLIFSIAAFVTALLGATGVGQAAADAVAQVVPRAKTADFAKNAGKLQGRKASTNPKAGQIPVLDSTGKLPASIGAVGPKGDAGPRGNPGVAGYERVVTQVSVPHNSTVEYRLGCPGGKNILSGGYAVPRRAGNNDTYTMLVYESHAVSDSAWTFRIKGEETGATTVVQLHAVCANVNQ